jgi:NTE family protein
MKDITLALGGGGIKGHAHIGVLRVLDREGYQVRAIAGTSAGGLWGVFYAAGFTPDEIEEQMAAADWANLYRRGSDEGPAMLGLSGVELVLREALGNCRFEDLRIPFAVTAVDINSGEEVILRHGNVVDAILATIAVPGVFPPAQYHGRMLIDGGVLDPVPVNLARALMPRLPVVAVALSPPLSDWEQPTPVRLLDSLPFLSTYIARLRIAKALNIFLRSVDIAGAMLTDLRLQIERPDVIIRPNVGNIGFLDEVDPRQVAKLGEEAAEAVLPALREAIGWRRWFARRVGGPKPAEIVIHEPEGIQEIKEENTDVDLDRE